MDSLFTVIAIALLSGCHSESKSRVEDHLSAPGEARSLQSESHASTRRAYGASVAHLGVSTRGRPIACEVYGEGPDTILFIASIHGSEPAGTPLLNALADRLKSNRLSLGDKRVVLIPISNPDGSEGEDAAQRKWR